MNLPQKMLVQFNELYAVPIPDGISVPTKDIIALRKRLIVEETNELFIELEAESPDMTKVIKELMDLIYVVMGTVVAILGRVDYMPFFKEVQRSNLSKVWDDGTIHKDEQGKVLKPPTYKPADIAKVLRKVGKRA
jgi:predicted HAD superfamily Cof-like phosphohydrolase